MSMRRIYPILLEAALVGLCISIFMAYVALDHNPQDEFYDSETRRVVVENLIPLMMSWLLACAVVYGRVRALITWLVARALR